VEASFEEVGPGSCAENAFNLLKKSDIYVLGPNKAVDVEASIA
jgi:hypothetical protein